MTYGLSCGGGGNCDGDYGGRGECESDCVMVMVTESKWDVTRGSKWRGFVYFHLIHLPEDKVDRTD